MQWFVLFVNIRTEEEVAQRFSENGMEVCCEVNIEERQWSDRIGQVEVPYFQSYVFEKFYSKNTNYVLETPGVVRRLYWLQKPAIIQEEEMQEVMAFFNSHPQIEHVNFTEGELVQITRGVLKDKKGIVLINDKHQVTLSIPALGCGFKVRLHKNQFGEIKK